MQLKIKKLIHAFTLTEILIIVVIVGIVAAVAVPSILSDFRTKQHITGLKKAVNVLNALISVNLAADGKSPYDNGDLFRYLKKNMHVIKSSTMLPWGVQLVKYDGSAYDWAIAPGENTYNNAVFYTTDGMRYEFMWHNEVNVYNRPKIRLYEDPLVSLNLITTTSDGSKRGLRCGSYGLNKTSKTTMPPCLIMVDVNGDKKPYPSNSGFYGLNKIKVLNPKSRKVDDVFSIMITDDRAVPFGIAAQRAMYGKKK